MKVKQIFQISIDFNVHQKYRITGVKYASQISGIQLLECEAAQSIILELYNSIMFNDFRQLVFMKKSWTHTFDNLLCFKMFKEKIKIMILKLSVDWYYKNFEAK